MGIRDIYLRSFLPAEDIFVPEQARQAEQFFLPLCSLELTKLNPLWTGKAHWLYTLEDPYNEAAAMHQTRLSVLDSSLGFHRENGRYRFDADFGFFAMSEGWKGHWQEAQTSYRAVREENLERSVEYHKGPASRRSRFLEKWGGSPKWLQGNETPRDEAGKAMTFLGQVDSLHFLAGPAKMLYLFYSPGTEQFVQVTQIT